MAGAALLLPEAFVGVSKRIGMTMRVAAAPLPALDDVCDMEQQQLSSAARTSHMPHHSCMVMPLLQHSTLGRHTDDLQVLLRWGLQKGCAVIPKAANPEHIIPAVDLLSWELPADMEARLDALEDGTKYCWDPAGIA